MVLSDLFYLVESAANRILIKNMCPQSIVIKPLKKQLVVVFFLYKFHFEKCSYSIFTAYLCIGSEIRYRINIKTNKGGD